MNDLVQKARDAANGVGTMKSDHGDYGLLDNLADEIEALRQRLAELEKCLEMADLTRDMAIASQDIKEKRAEKAEAKLAQAERERDEWKVRSIKSDGRYFTMGWDEGFREGIEAAAQLMSDDLPNWRDDIRWAVSDTIDEIRNLSPASPTDTVRQAAETLLDAWSNSETITADDEAQNTADITDTGVCANEIVESWLRALAAREGE